MVDDKKERVVDYDVANALFSLDHSTGVLRWKRRSMAYFSSERIQNSWNSQFAGAVVGCVSNGGYLTTKITLGGEAYSFLVHRVVWLLIYGVWPDTIDHIDGVKLNNRPSNLRSVSQTEQTKSKATSKNNTSGVHGVRVTKGGRYEARGSKDEQLGTFSTLRDAANARAEWEARNGYAVNHGTDLPRRLS
jgi:hypothetical protein